jgi:hypothetical protein
VKTGALSISSKQRRKQQQQQQMMMMIIIIISMGCRQGCKDAAAAAVVMGYGMPQP